MKVPQQKYRFQFFFILTTDLIVGNTQSRIILALPGTNKNDSSITEETES
jgi:hypothetical protein